MVFRASGVRDAKITVGNLLVVKCKVVKVLYNEAKEVLESEGLIGFRRYLRMMSGHQW